MRQLAGRGWTRAAIAVGLVALAGCSWPQFGHDAAHSGNNPFEVALNVGNVGGLTQVWSATSGAITSSPVIADGVVYTTTATNRLNAYDATGTTNCTGSPKVCTPLWHSKNLAGAIVGSAAVDHGVVYVTGVGERLFAFDAKGQNCNTNTSPPTCAPLWTAPLGGEAFSAPTVAGGIVYTTSIRSNSQQLAAFDATGTAGCSGVPKVCTPLWTAFSVISGENQAARSAPAVADGRVFMTVSRSGSLNDEGNAVAVGAYDAAGITGCSGVPKVCTPLWSSPALSSAVSSPSIDHGVLYAFDDTGVSAFDATGVANCTGTPLTCQPLWTADRVAFPQASAGMAVAGGAVFAGSPGGIAAFDAAGATGCSGAPKVCAPLWTSPAGTEPAPAVANGVLFTTDGNGISALDATGTANCTGVPKVCTPLWTAAGPFAASSPSIVNGHVYVGGTDGLRVFALA